MKHDVPAAEPHGLREQVTGTTDTLIAASDGIVILANASEDLDAEVIPELFTTGLGIARRTSEGAGRVLSSTPSFAQESQPAIDRINSALSAA